MSLIKEMLVIAASFSAGFIIGSSEDSKTKQMIDGYVEKVKLTYKDLKALVLTALNNIEGVDSEDIKANIAKGVDFLKEKLSKIIEFTEPEEEIDNLDIPTTIERKYTFKNEDKTEPKKNNGKKQK